MLSAIPQPAGAEGYEKAGRDDDRALLHNGGAFVPLKSP